MHYQLCYAGRHLRAVKGLSRDFPEKCPHIKRRSEKRTAPGEGGAQTRLRCMAALMKAANSGCAAVGLDLNSGWYCTPTNHG